MRTGSLEPYDCTLSDAVDEEPALSLLVPDLPSVGSGDEGVHGADDKAILLLAGKLLERRERD